MKWQARTERPSRSFIIEHDPSAGFYVYIYDEEGRLTHDYCQDSLEQAKGFATRKFSVSPDSWREIEKD